MHIRNIIEHFLSKECTEKFAAWAFGEDFKDTLTNYNAHTKWNNFHSDILILKGDGLPKDDVPKMIEIWKTQKAQQ